MNQAESHTIRPAARRRWVAGLLWLALLAAGAGAYFLKPAAKHPDMAAGQKPGRPSNPSIPVAIEHAKQGDFPLYLTGLGTVTALHTVTVRPRVDGELIRVAFSEGQQVQAGDLLAEIDPRPFQVQLQQAEGQLLRDQALLKNAELDLARYRTLLEQDSIAAQQTVTQEALVQQYKGNLAVDRAQVDNAKLQLTYARVTAPVSGRVGLRLVDKGNIVHANDANGLVVITQIQPIAVVFSLPEDALPKVMQRWRTGAGIAVEAYDRAGKNKLASGQLLAVDNQIDPSTGTVKLKAQFPNDDRALFSNQFVNIKMLLETLRGATLVSTAAIQRGVAGAFVYRVKEDNTVTVSPVTLGPVEGDQAVVLDGLSPDQAVVVDGADKLREGVKVEVIERNAAPTEKTGAAQGKRQVGGKVP